MSQPAGNRFEEFMVRALELPSVDQYVLIEANCGAPDHGEELSKLLTGRLNWGVSSRRRHVSSWVASA